jgi:conjugal transfer pilus assembly protein TraW
MKRRFVLVATSLLTASLSALAQQKPIAPTYPILEPNMIQELMKHLERMQADGSLGKLLDEGNRRAENSIRNPAPVAGIKAAFRARTFYYDPTMVVNQDIVAPDGTIIARKGQTANPLEQVAWPSTWIFADWRDPAQVREVTAQVAARKESVRVILVGGSYAAAAKALDRQVFFDQQGLLTRKFGIEHTPATVRQDGLRLRIDEFPARAP